MTEDKTKSQTSNAGAGCRVCYAVKKCQIFDYPCRLMITCNMYISIIFALSKPERNVDNMACICNLLF